MIAPNALNLLFEHAIARYQALWPQLAGLSEAQFTEAARTGQRSLRDRLVALANEQRRWLRHLRDEPAQADADPADYQNVSSIRGLCQSSLADIVIFAEGMDFATLAALPKGLKEPTWLILLHLAQQAISEAAVIGHELAGWGVEAAAPSLLGYSSER